MIDKSAVIIIIDKVNYISTTIINRRSKMKKVLLLVSLVLAVSVMFTACVIETKSESTKKSYVSSTYSDEDMEAAMKVIEDEFSTWKGCKMNSLTYAGDECNTQENLDWLKSLKDGKNYAEVAEFLCSFHSPTKDADLKDTAWEKDKEYEDYQWWLARVEGGDWELVTFGY